MTSGKDFSPIVVFAFNRPLSLKNCIDSLKKNPEAINSDLYIFVDGERNGVVGEAELVRRVQEIANSVDGFKSVKVTIQEVNQGLAKSIINGTTEVIEQYGKAIVVEDDLVVTPNFLCYMNQMLEFYELHKDVCQISGFGLKIKCPIDYNYDVYPHYRAMSWGWATWADRWNTIDWSMSRFKELAQNRKCRDAFNRGGSDLFGMLKDCYNRKNNSWYIRFNFDMHLKNKLCITPIQSFVYNAGFDKNATHCNGYNRYHIDLIPDSKRCFNVPDTINVDERISRQVVTYWSVMSRIKGKIQQYLRK